MRRRRAAPTVKSRTNRRAMDQERRRSGGGVESVSDLFDSKDIADPADGMKHLCREWIIDLGPQASHHDIDKILAGIEVNVPDLFHDFGPGNNIAGGRGEI